MRSRGSWSRSSISVSRATVTCKLFSLPIDPIYEFVFWLSMWDCEMGRNFGVLIQPYITLCLLSVCV